MAEDDDHRGPIIGADCEREANHHVRAMIGRTWRSGRCTPRTTGSIGAAMGTTALPWDDRWWAVPVKCGGVSRFVVIDTRSLERRVILERDTIGHPQFCPDDPDLLFYAGPLTDRVWVIRRDGSGNRRLYQEVAVVSPRSLLRISTGGVGVENP